MKNNKPSRKERKEKADRKREVIKQILVSAFKNICRDCIEEKHEIVKLQFGNKFTKEELYEEMLKSSELFNAIIEVAKKQYPKEQHMVVSASYAAKKELGIS